MAQRDPKRPIADSYGLYASYRLGLYETVANAYCHDDHWRGSFAQAISNAACGRLEQAESLTRNLISSSKTRRLRMPLADALAPFAPELALEVAQSGGDIPTPLHAALLLRVGRRQEAIDLIQRAIAKGGARSKPELHLFKSNAMTCTPTEQLALLNAFLSRYDLPPLTLINPVLPPGPANLVANAAYQPISGPLVSVLMTAYRSADRIEAAIRSLLQQTYHNLEVIVVDDASDDDTGDIVQALAAEDARVRYYRLPCNVGTYVAKGIGLRHAKGEFITCHDSDDWSHPLRIERQIRPLLHNKYLVFTTSQWVRMQDDGIYYARPVHPLMRLNPASPLFRKELVLSRAGAWDPVRTGADSEFLARLKLVFGRLAWRRIAQPLAFGSHRPDSLMTAADTGYCARGMSPTRLAYWEAWGHWHIAELRAGRKPFLPADLLAERRFSAPDAIRVPPEAIRACLLS